MWLEKSTLHTGGDPRPEAHGQVPPSPPQEACRWYLCLSSLFPQSVSHDPPGMPHLLLSSRDWAWFLRLAEPFVKAGRNEIQSNTQSGHTFGWLCGPMTV